MFAASRSLTNRRFALPDGRVTRSWRGHSAPVLDMALDASGSLLATASADGSARVRGSASRPPAGVVMMSKGRVGVYWYGGRDSGMGVVV